MNKAEFDTIVDDFKTKSDEQRGSLAAIYGDILQSIGPAVVKAKYAAEQLSPSVRGVPELQQLLQIMDGGFSKVATEIISEAQSVAATPAEVETPAEDEGT